MAHPDLPDVINRYLDAYETKDVSMLIDCLDEHVYFENVSNHAGQMSMEGRERFREVAEHSAGAFSARRQEVRDVIADQDNGRYAIELLFHGTLAVDMGDDMKAGTEIHLRGVSLMSVVGDKITRILDLS